MSIDRENCEAWFLDYYEGNLSKEGVEEMYAFLVLNPDLREVFDAYDEVSFSPDSKISFSGKDDLKRPVVVEDGISESNYEEYFIGEIENVLSVEEKNQLEKFLLQFPAKRKELDVLRSTILLPENEIVFENKSSLKKSILVSAENFEKMAIASVEGLLNAEEEKVLSASIAADAEQKKAYELFAKTKLVTDSSIVFEDKESLKKKENDRGGFWWIRDVRFAAAAAVALLIGIFFWNYAGNNPGGTSISKSVANNDVQPKNNSNVFGNKTPVTDSSNDVAANNTHHKGIIIPINVPHKDGAVASNDTHHKGIIIPINVPHKDGVADIDQTHFDAIAFNGKMKLLPTNNEQPINFSGEFYNSNETPVAAVSSRETITPGQYAMRWMKKELDRSTNSKDENDVYTAMQQNKNENVTGFDLTSSAVNAFSEATGANIKLAKEATGTTFTVGKYKVWLNKKN